MIRNVEDLDFATNIQKFNDNMTNLVNLGEDVENILAKKDYS